MAGAGEPSSGCSQSHRVGHGSVRMPGPLLRVGSGETKPLLRVYLWSRCAVVPGILRASGAAQRRIPVMYGERQRASKESDHENAEETEVF